MVDQPASDVLQKAHDDLEKRIRERTSELVKATESLKGEIAERKLAEEVAREARQLLEKIFENLEEVVMVADPATRKITACNPAVKKVYGYRQDEVIGRSTRFLHTSESAYKKFRKDVLVSLNKEKIFRNEYKMRRKDGSDFYTDNTISDIRDDSGNLIGLVNIQRDISDVYRPGKNCIRPMKSLSSAFKSGHPS